MAKSATKKDINQLAKSIVDIATSSVAKPKKTKKKVAKKSSG